ncbi:hypothetical protein TSUD_119300 [Trifolium subterraneum]|uniref:CSC1/OSCA1-like 7TM region domain-containing protein n=1 Tax=Trifolium subterraneum TaxID=3900 RepID=A0A2Z6NNN1_TRISU|nr:hypothetical protein TSUD_119300 [Trifolium subterraneum]
MSNLSSVKHVNIVDVTSLSDQNTPLILLNWLVELANIESLTVSLNTLTVLSLVPDLLKVEFPSLYDLKSLKVITTHSHSSIPKEIVNFLLQNAPSAKVTSHNWLSEYQAHTVNGFTFSVKALTKFTQVLNREWNEDIITGTAFEQLYAFLHQSPTQIPRTIGVSIPMKATFFMTHIMLKPREIEERPWILGLWTIPKLFQAFKLYFLLGIVYAVVTPILLPFILVFFAFAYSVYRHQIIKVYNQQYESAAAFWPQVHSRIIASLTAASVRLAYHQKGS